VKLILAVVSGTLVIQTSIFMMVWLLIFAFDENNFARAN
jgi:hypothetical protein